MTKFVTTTTLDKPTNQQYLLLDGILDCQKKAFYNNISFDTDMEFTSSGTTLVHVKAYYSSTDDCSESHAFNTTFDFSVKNSSNKSKLDKLNKFINKV